MLIPRQHESIVRPIQAGPYPKIDPYARPFPPDFWEWYPPGLFVEQSDALSIVNGGSGYKVDDQLIVLGGTPADAGPGPIAPAIGNTTTTTISNTATGGKFTITVNDQNGGSATTPPMDFNIDAATMQATLQSRGIDGATTIPVSMPATPSGLCITRAPSKLRLSLAPSYLTGGSAVLIMPTTFSVASVGNTWNLNVQATAGTFAITGSFLNGAPALTPPMAYNIAAADLQNMLQYLPISGADAIMVSSFPAPAGQMNYVINATTGYLQLVVDGSQLPGGTATLTFANTAVTLVNLTQVGSYKSLPDNPVSVVGGSGQGAQFFVLNNVNYPNLITAL